MTIKIIEGEFSPWQELETYEQQHLTAGQYGACSAFTGTMRNFNQGDQVVGMTLEHYPGMTDQQLQTICDEAAKRWSLDDALIIHRVGDILPGDSIVLTACWSAHRVDAFEACRFLMEALKSRAPFWKKEILDDKSSRWVDKNTPG